MYFGLDPSGIYIKIENRTPQVIHDLCYQIGDFEVEKVVKILPNENQTVYIFSSNYERDYSISFFFQTQPERKFFFADIIKKTTPDHLWFYYDFQIVEKDSRLKITSSQDIT